MPLSPSLPLPLPIPLPFLVFVRSFFAYVHYNVMSNEGSIIRGNAECADVLSHRHTSKQWRIDGRRQGKKNFGAITFRRCPLH